MLSINSHYIERGLEKAMATHSSTLAWKIPWTEEPGRLQSMGSWRVGHDFTFTFVFHFHALEKEMATHSSVLAWRIPGMVEPGGLPPMGSHRVRHDWSDLAAERGWGLSAFSSGNQDGCHHEKETPDSELQKMKQNETDHPGDMSVRDGRGVGRARQTKNTGSSSAPLKKSKLQGSHQAVKYRWYLRWLLNKYNEKYLTWFSCWSQWRKRLIEEKCYFTFWVWENQQASNFTFFPNSDLPNARVLMGPFSKKRWVTACSELRCIVLSDKRRPGMGVWAPLCRTERPSLKAISIHQRRNTCSPHSGWAPPFQLSSWSDFIRLCSLGLSDARRRVVSMAGLAVTQPSDWHAAHLRGFASTLQSGTCAFQVPQFEGGICVLLGDLGEISVEGWQQKQNSLTRVGRCKNFDDAHSLGPDSRLVSAGVLTEDKNQTQVVQETLRKGLISEVWACRKETEKDYCFSPRSRGPAW